MLKRFFISMLGTVAGLWISIVLAIFALIMVGASVMSNFGRGDSSLKVDKRSFLYLDLSGEIAERYQSKPLMELLRSIETDDAPTLEDMLKAINLATNDDNIEGLYMRCEGSMIGYAGREELLEAIAGFKESGKWVIAYANAYPQGDYLLASSADEVYLNPMGAVDIHGIGGMTPFFKSLLDKLGIKMQIIKVGTFKSAVEPYILNEMSAPAKLQLQQYCDSIWDYVACTIGRNRGIGADSVRMLAPQMLFTAPAEKILADSLVDGLRYERLVDKYLHELTDIEEDKELRSVTPAEYLSARGIEYSASREHIAVYYAVGEISDEGKEGIIGPDVVADITKLADDKNVNGMVLRVNSPGGSAFASEQIWEAIQYFKSKHKPVYVSMGDYAASGGYYISCGADSIFADRTTITGSIGVFGMIPDFSGLVTDKLGVHFSTVETNPNATGIGVLEAMTPQQYAAMQQSVENIYELFTARVAEGRNMPQDSVKSIAEGRVWIAGRALELGLVDRIGSLRTTVCALADSLGLAHEAYVSYPRIDEKPWEILLRQSMTLEGASSAVNAELYHQLRFIDRLRRQNPMQTRMPEFIVE